MVLDPYFGIISFGTIVGLLWFLRRSNAREMNRVTAIDLALTVLIGGFIGARLLHVFYEEWEMYRAYPIGVLQVWNGGFVFLGGLTGALISGVLFCKIKGEPFWFWADIATPPIALGYALGRVGCFFNGCCYGMPADVPWAVELHGSLRHPTPLYATAWELAVIVLLMLNRSKFKTSGMLFNVWLLFHGAGRIVMEMFRADPRGHLILGVTLGTAMSAVLMSWALFNIVASRLHH